MPTIISHESCKYVGNMVNVKNADLCRFLMLIHHHGFANENTTITFLKDEFYWNTKIQQKIQQYIPYNKQNSR